MMVVALIEVDLVEEDTCVDCDQRQKMKEKITYVDQREALLVQHYLKVTCDEDKKD